MARAPEFRKSITVNRPETDLRSAGQVPVSRPYNRPRPDVIPITKRRGTNVNYDTTRSYGLTLEDVEYLRDGDEVLQARLYRPQGPGPFPTLLYLHGGAWSSNDRTTNPKLPQTVASSGVLVCSIDFRQGGTHPFPSSMIDINSAIRWLKAHARDFNADPAVIGGAGSSSGGHLILLAAMRPRDARYTIRPFSEAPSLDASL